MTSCFHANPVKSTQIWQFFSYLFLFCYYYYYFFFIFQLKRYRIQDGEILNRRRPDYRSSSWFLLHQTREKPLPLRATVCFSIEHARVRHAPRDAFDVNFISVSVQKNANFSPKARKKERFKPSLPYCIYLVCKLNIKPKFWAFLPSSGRDSWARWTQHSEQQFHTMYVI